MARAQRKNIEDTQDNKPKDAWMSRVVSAWETSDSYYTANLENRIVRNQFLFDSKHPPGSKYHTDAYKFRSRLFRPKIRSAIRKTEAAGVQAFFSTVDCIDIKAENEGDQQAQIAADLAGAALKYHLKNTMKWFQVCIGGLQDACKTGVVCSYNHWLKKTARYSVKNPVFGPDGQHVRDEKGEPVYETEEKEEILEDRPNVDLFPFSHLRFHPGAKWVDPMNTSPFVCRIMPMYVCDIKARMEEGTPEKNRWKKLSDAEILVAKMTMNTDADRQAREQGKEDPLELQTPGVGDYDMSIVLHWFMLDPKDGRKYEFYTLGTKERLSEPKLLSKAYPHKKVPITYGTYILEAHKCVATGMPELGESLNKEANNISNSRLDNIQLVLNKRYIVARGKQVDTRSLLMNAPASVTFANNPTEDVVPLEFSDITSSAYQEQARIDNDQDELLGNFSQSSVQSNRSLNDTATGMQLAHGSAGQMTDYGLRTFVETWEEDTLRQILSLIQHFETSEKVIGAAAQSAKMGEKYAPKDEQGNPAMQGGQPVKFQPTDDMLHGDITLTVDVGVGASNPVFKAQQFIGAIKQFTEILVMLKEAQVTGVQAAEIAKEMFGYIGYKDGSRFFKLDEQGQSIDPQVQEMQAEIQRLTQQIESDQVKMEGQKAIKQMELQQQTASDRKEREQRWNELVANNNTKKAVALINARAKQKDVETRERMNRENNASNEKVAKEGNATTKAVAKSKPKSKAA